MSVLELEQLIIEIDDPSAPVRVPASGGLSLSTAEREIVALAGPSGVGKSLLGLAILGLLPAEARARGSIRFGGQELLGLAAEPYRKLRGRQLAMIFQDPYSALNPVRSIGSLIAEAITVHRPLPRREAKAQAIAALSRVGLASAQSVARAYPHQLSGGMRQRALIALATVHRPKLLIADEPTAQLDPLSAAQVLELLRMLVEEDQLALLLITHDRAIQSGFAGRVVELL